MSVLRRYDDRPEQLGDLWTLQRSSDVLICTLRTHLLGWELVVRINGELSRSKVCKSETDVFDTSDNWRDAFVMNGWTNV